MIARLLLLAWAATACHTAFAFAAPSSPPDALSLQIGGIRFRNADLRSMYGSATVVGLRFLVAVDERSELVFGAGFGFARGNPYDTPDFRSDADEILRLVPIDVGWRVNATSHPVYRLWFTILGRALWSREEIPASPPGAEGSSRIESDWGRGILLAVGPEVRLRDRRIAIGADLGFGLQGVPDSRHGRGGEDLSGLEIRIYLSYFGRGGGLR